MMGLQGDALAVALDITKRFPEAKITSGRRTISEQALAMAENSARNRNWIRETYSLGRAATECQDWVDRHPSADKRAMATAFCTIIAALPPDDQRRLSRHLTGEALDIKPIVGGIAEEVIRVLSDWATRKAGKFLTREGGLTIWHWQAH